MSEEFVKYAKAGAIATITLNRPEKYNTLRFEMIERLSEVLRALSSRSRLRISPPRQWLRGRTFFLSAHYS